MTFYRDWWRTNLTYFQANPLGACLTLLTVAALGALPAAELRTFWGLIDAVVARAGWRETGLWLAGAGVVMVLQPLLSRVLWPLQEWLTRSGEYYLTTRLLERAARTPLLEFESPAFFNLYAQANKGVREEIYGMLDSTLTMGRTLISIAAVLGTLAALNWQAAAVLMGVGAPAWAIQAWSAARWGAMMRAQVPRARYVDYLGELLVKRQYAQEVRLFGTAGVLLERWRKERWALGRERNLFSIKHGSRQAVVLSIGSMGYLGALALLGLSVLAGRITLGAFAGGLRAAEQLQGSVLGLMFKIGQIRQSGVFVSDLWAFLDAPGALPDPAAGAPELPPQADVDFNNVTFRYPGRTEPVLQDVSFTARHGELIAVVGENGAGKSTLVKLLLGLYPPSAGSVKVGGVEVSAPQGAGARAATAPVFQEFVRYSLKAGENIAVADTTALDDQARIDAAAAGSGADAVISGLPQAYATQLGKEFDDGQELSGGQWQKLAIARAYMRKAVLLVLDEPTAALDPLAEVDVFQRFRELARGRTAFFISHRLGAARLADRILVLKEGRLVEDGRHDELIAQNGEYAALFGAQAAWYRKEKAG